MPTVTKNRHRAFTIVEVIVALTILVFGLGAIYMHMIGADQNGHARIERMQVRWLAHERLAELRAAPYTSLKGWQPGEWHAWQAMGERATASARIDPQPDGSIEVEVRAGVIQADPKKEPQNVVTVRGMVAP